MSIKSARSHIFACQSGTGVKITRTFLLQSVKWELYGNNIFAFGDSVYQQSKGVCMGSFLSAFLQITTAMFLERQWKAIGFHPLTPLSLSTKTHHDSLLVNTPPPLVGRFRDNIYFVVDTTTCVQSLLSLVREIYCCPAKIEGINNDASPLTTTVMFATDTGSFTSISPSRFPLHTSKVSFYPYTVKQLYTKDAFLTVGWLIGCLHRFREYCLSSEDFLNTYMLHLLNCAFTDVPVPLLFAAHQHYFS